VAMRDARGAVRSRLRSHAHHPRGTSAERHASHPEEDRGGDVLTGPQPARPGNWSVTEWHSRQATA